MDNWPISFALVEEVEARIRAHIHATPLRSYPPLDAAVGHGVRVFVKHENHQPTNAFKVRAGLAVLSDMSDEERRRGVLAATRGNHGLGVAWAGERLGTPVTICVPFGNNPEKNDAMRGFGVELIEHGSDYDEALAHAHAIAKARSLKLVHSTNDPLVLAGATTLSLEILRERPDVDAMVIAIGGGSQAVGAITAARVLAPHVAVYGVQAERAPAIFESWRAKKKIATDTADTFADGMATRTPYDLTFEPLCDGLAGFVTVSEAEIAGAVRLYLSTTHNLSEGAGAAGLAGLVKLAPELRGKRVAVVLSGSNIDARTLRRIMSGEL